MTFPIHREKRSQGYTLVEALVASIILMIGISAAASLSLTMVAQEEINERTGRGLNYLENAASLYQLGLSGTEIAALMPLDPAVTSLAATDQTAAVTGLGNMTYGEITVTFDSTSATSTWTAGAWTGGDNSTTRSVTVNAYRSSQHVTP
jgi:type II secretory pathway pseudopilin PulG